MTDTPPPLSLPLPHAAPAPSRGRPARALTRGLVPRWPALAGAGLALAVPLGVAFADGFGASQFNAFKQPAVTADSNSAPAVLARSNTVAVEATGVSINNDPTFGDGVHASGRVGVQARGIKTAIEASSEKGAAVEASGATFGVRAKSTDGPGVDADSNKGPGVRARAAAGAAVEAKGSRFGVEATGDTGVFSTSTAPDGVGVFGAANGAGGIGVNGQGISLGVRASSPDGNGLQASSNRGIGADLSGGRAPALLRPAAAAGRPQAASGAHERGELYVDANGDLFLCTAPGTPGTWVKVAVTPA